jgi:hypothetical protein
LTCAPTADQSVSNFQAVSVTLADHARIDCGVGTEAINITPGESTWVNNRAIGVNGTLLRTAFTTAALIPDEAVGNGLNANAVNAGVQDTRIILFAATVPIVGTGCGAHATPADLTFLTAASAVVLCQDYLLRQRDDCSCQKHREL